MAMTEINIGEKYLGLLV